MFGGRFKNIFVYLMILLAAVFLLYNFSSQSKKAEEVPISQVAAEAKAGRIEQITISGDYSTLKVEFKDRREPVLSRQGPDVDVVETLRNLGVSEEEIAAITIGYQQPSGWASWMPLLSGILPAILFMVLFYFLLRQAQGSNSQALSFGKSRARMFTGDQPTVTFEDVAGVEEAKEELYEVVEFLKEPEKFIALGARIPKGVLLVGAPGTGKTLMAKAVSGEAGVPFFSISGSEFVEMFVGVGASRVRDLFDQAKRHSPCIVFVDEIDAVGRLRGAGLGGSHDEREQTLNQILVEMDGFDTDTNVIILAATNRPDILDPALLRPGRFDRRVVLDIPDINGRKGILDVHVRGKPLANDIDLEILARQTPGFVGADIESMVNEAAILAARANKKVIGMEEFEEAIERVLAGPERKSRIIGDEEKEIIAHHEAGHAMVMSKLPHCDPVHKVSIVSRGMALGYTMPLPEEDRYLKHRAKFKDELAGLLGGRAAEELMFNDVTTGAASDLVQATKLARKMVCEYGMSEDLGPMTFGKKQELIFLGREIAEQRDYSEAVAQEIDREVRGFIDEAHSRAREILTTYRDKLIALAQRLIEKETLEGAELEAMLA
ncbi:MAG: ATP-dependent zinc metalloprotease FtsH [Anaerolineae bacterium]